MPFKSANVGAVIFPPREVREEKRRDWLAGARSALLMAFEKSIAIIHEPEETPKDEADKVHHMHFYAWAGVAKNQEAWITELLEAISTYDREIEREAVSVKPLGNDVGALRYLVHADNKDKRQYLPSDVLASSPGVLATFQKALEATAKPTIEELLAIRTKTDLARRVGADNYSRYKMVWLDLQDEASLDTRIEQYRKAQWDVRLAAVEQLEKAMKKFPAGSEDKSEIYKLVRSARDILLMDDGF